MVTDSDSAIAFQRNYILFFENVFFFYQLHWHEYNLNNLEFQKLRSNLFIT